MDDVQNEPAASLVTEEEVDDGFRPDETPSKKTAAASKDVSPPEDPAEAKDAKEAEEQEEEAVEEPSKTQQLLEGHWHQLQARAASPDQEGRRRFLAWNGHGHVIFNTEDRRLEVVYSVDPSDVHRFKASTNIQMAALSPNACAVSSCEPGEPIHIYPRERWDKASFVAVSSSRDEIVEALACGENFLAVLTSSRLLRLYSLTGLPLGVLSMSGRSVALAARGPRLLVVTGCPGQRSRNRGGEGGEYVEEALEYRLLDFRSRSERSSGRLPLSANSGLRWVGFSEEILPLAIDTKGTVRALFAGGAGCWGPAGGAGGEWTIVADLSGEESKCGPLWAVDARQNLLLVAEAGQDRQEPMPEPSTLESGEERTTAPLFGYGSDLREICWKLSVGPVFGCAQFLENAAREGLMTEHLTEMHNSSLDAELDDSIVTSASSARLKAGLTLFVQLVKNEDQERALDAAVHYLAVAGGSKQLSNAGAIAEKARLYKLADKLATLPRLSQPSNQASNQRTPHSLPKSVGQSYTPLFVPGESYADQGSQQRSTSDVTTADKLAELKARSIDRKASSSSVLNSSTEDLGAKTEPLHFQPPPPNQINQIPSLPSPTVPAASGAASSAFAAVAAAAGQAAGGAGGGAAGGGAGGAGQATSPSAARTPGVANPFAKRTKSGPGLQRVAPHLLRDAIQAAAPPLKMQRLG